MINYGNRRLCSYYPSDGYYCDGACGGFLFMGVASKHKIRIYFGFYSSLAFSCDSHPFSTVTSFQDFW